MLQKKNFFLCCYVSIVSSLLAYIFGDVSKICKREIKRPTREL